MRFAHLLARGGGGVGGRVLLLACPAVLCAELLRLVSRLRFPIGKLAANSNQQAFGGRSTANELAVAPGASGAVFVKSNRRRSPTQLLVPQALMVVDDEEDQSSQ